MSKNKYSLPLNKKDIEGIKFSAPAHIGKLKHSIDFRCKVGREIFSAFAGEVVRVKNDSNIGGPDKKFWHDGNWVAIKHLNGEYSLYEHLKFKGVVVKVGGKVDRGQLIGYSGNTGYSSVPHLHFHVFVFNGLNPEEDFESLPIDWDRAGNVFLASNKKEE